MQRLWLGCVVAVGATVLLAGTFGCGTPPPPGPGPDGGAAVSPAGTAHPSESIAVRGYEVVRVYPHDPEAFTQGLLYYQGDLYESTGRYGFSSVRKVQLETGRILQRFELPRDLFGEGLALAGDRLFQLTWLSGSGFVLDRARLQPVARFAQVTEGWGLTYDGTHLIQSDGSARLYFLDRDTLELVRTVQVRDGTELVDQLNELEMLDGLVYANVWHRDEILGIDPHSGQVRVRVDMAGLDDGARQSDPEAVLNGIAYDPDTGRIFVTGKFWPRLYEVRFVRAR